MSYKITIEKVGYKEIQETITVGVTEDYKKKLYEQNPANYENSDAFKYDKEWIRRPRIVESTITILEQTIEELDLKTVIKAVNGI
jgi:hypothetical protein